MRSGWCGCYYLCGKLVVTTVAVQASVGPMKKFRSASVAIGMGLAMTAACSSSNPNGVDGGANSADAAAAKNAIPLSSPNGEFYTAALKIGAQSFALDLDTGSSTTGIASSTCTSCTNAGVTSLYTPTTTGTSTGMAAQAQYADGSGWSGTVYADHVGLGNGTPDVPLDLVAITSQNGFFRDAAYQGILGLGPTELLARGTTSYFTAVGTAGVTPEMAFEFCERNGTMWLGDYDESFAASPMRFTKSRESGQDPFYAVNMTDMGIDGVSLGFGDATFQDPIVDTGTSLFYIPGQVITALATKVSASTGFKQLFPNQTLSPNSNQGCVQASNGVTDAMVNATLPKMSMSFPTVDGGSVFAVSVDAANSYLYSAGNREYCLSIQDDQGAGAIMGDSILRSMITVINTQTNEIGFATDKHCSVAQAADRSRDTTVHLRTEHGHPLDQRHRQRHTN